MASRVARHGRGADRMQRTTKSVLGEAFEYDLRAPWQKERDAKRTVVERPGWMSDRSLLPKKPPGKP